MKRLSNGFSRSIFYIALGVMSLGSIGVVDAQETQVTPTPVSSALPQGLEKSLGNIVVSESQTRTGSQDFMRLRDPFRRLTLPEAIRKDAEPLERFSAEQLQMVGIITGPTRPRALILTPEGTSHFVTENSRIGTHKGVVKKIAKDSVMIQEKIINVFGQEENVETRIKLAAKEKKIQKAPENMSPQEIPNGVVIPSQMNPGQMSPEQLDYYRKLRGQ